MIVLDGSVTLAWCFEDEATPATDALLERVRDEGAVVPSLWPLELGNVLLGAQRRGRLDAAQVAGRLAVLDELAIAVDDQTPARALREILSLAAAFGLTTYDASYLDLALRRGVPLATLDRTLARAARSSGVDVLP